MATWDGSPLEETISAVQEESGPLKVESELPWVPKQEVQTKDVNQNSDVGNIDVTQYTAIQKDPNTLEIDETEESFLRGIHSQDDVPDNQVASVHQILRASASSTDISSAYDKLSLTDGCHRSVSVDLCDHCLELDMQVACSESITFWHNIQCKGSTPEGCHVKLWSKFMKKLSDCYPNHNALISKTTVAMLKSLLHINQSDASAAVEYARFVELMKFFGPLRNDDGVMLEQLHNVARNSSKKKDAKKRKSETISWFAGKMTRTEADQRLSTEKEGTYLIRMSETREASFVISVKDDEVIEHFEIPQDYKEAAKSSPFDAKLSLNNRTYSNLVDAVNSLTSYPLKHENGDEVWCVHICPGLPLNGVIIGYKKTG